MYWKPWRATYLFQARAIVLHGRMAGQPGSHFAKDSGGVRVTRFRNPIVNPLAVASRRNDPGSFQVSEMPGDFWLINFQNFDKKTDAHLVLADEIYQAQPRSVRQCFEEKSDVVFVVCHASVGTV